jgi:hypothetical protein
VGNLSAERVRVLKKMGCPVEHPLKPFSKNYRFFAAFFFAPLAAFFAIVFSLELSDSASDGPLGPSQRVG